MKVSLPLKSIVFLLVTITISSATAAVTTHFRDVQPGSWYESGVNTMNEMGVMKGYSNGTFGVNDTVTRAQLATILDRYNTTLSEAFHPYILGLTNLQLKLQQELTGSSWKKYTENFYYFPSLDGRSSPVANSITSSTPYFTDVNNATLIPMACENAEKCLFYIKHDGDENFYGPFGDDIKRLKKEATGVNAPLPDNFDQLMKIGGGSGLKG